jgi:hypothetical protein
MPYPNSLSVLRSSAVRVFEAPHSPHQPRSEVTGSGLLGCGGDGSMCLVDGVRHTETENRRDCRWLARILLPPNANRRCPLHVGLDSDKDDEGPIIPQGTKSICRSRYPDAYRSSERAVRPVDRMKRAFSFSSFSGLVPTVLTMVRVHGNLLRFYSCRTR